MTPNVLPAELTELLTRLAQQSDASRLLLSRLLVGLSKMLLDPLIVMQDRVQVLKQNALSVKQQADCINQMHQSGNELLALVNSLISYSQTSFGEIENTTYPENVTAITPPSTEELKDVHALVIDDDELRRETLLKQLQAYGLQCTASTTQQALQRLHMAEQEQASYQIAIISAEHFDHHAAYLARTVKATPQLHHVMLALALPTQLLGFEKERAYFGGFTCVLNLSKPLRLQNKLINSWRGWSAKVNFSRQETLVSQNRILLVEDDPIPQKVTQRQLAELGYEVDIAGDGRTALKLLEQNQYSLVFMDVGLPDISGLEVTAEIRKRENGHHHTPIVGLTINALETDEEHGLEAGMDEYLVKPLLHDRLRSVLDRWIVEKTMH